jgi:hypothetical protein
MTRVNDPSSSNQDERLADFTERVLKGQAKEIESNVDKELHDLEETILRLNSILPPASLDEAAAKQMLVRLKARVRKQGKTTKPSFWEKWFGSEWRSGLPRPQFGLAFAAIVMIIFVVLLIPSLVSGAGPITATALTSSQSTTLIIVLAAVILFIFWIWRRK